VRSDGERPGENHRGFDGAPRFLGIDARGPVAIIDWDTTPPGTRLANFADFLWAYAHPNLYGDGEAAAHIRE
jgi:hypothetical protein